MISARVQLTQPLRAERQFVATTGSQHHILLDDPAGGTGPKPIELVAVALAGCTAFDVITILRQKYHQRVTEYEVRVEADQAERPPQVFTDVRIVHVITGCEIDRSGSRGGDSTIRGKILFGGRHGQTDCEHSYHLRGHGRKDQLSRLGEGCSLGRGSTQGAARNAQAFAIGGKVSLGLSRPSMVSGAAGASADTLDLIRMSRSRATNSLRLGMPISSSRGNLVPNDSSSECWSSSAMSESEAQVAHGFLRIEFRRVQCHYLRQAPLNVPEQHSMPPFAGRSE